VRLITWNVNRGLPHAICSLDTADAARTPASRRRAGVVIATREPLEPGEPIPVPWPVPRLTIEAAVYHHAWRDDGLSDHSPLEADLTPA
jgi:hypothetical protein